MKSKNWQRQHWYFVALLIGIFIMIGLLSVRYDRSVDITLSQRHELSPQSVKVVKQFTTPVTVKAFVRGNPQVKKLIGRIVAKYQQHAEMNLLFENIDTAVDLVREYGISRDGELIFEYQGRRSHSPDLSETSMTRALYRLLRSAPRRVIFVTGHGEREGSNDLSGYAALFERLAEADMKVGKLDLNVAKSVPDDVDLLVIADARIDFSEAENNAVEKYLQRGGRLLWLAEPDSARLPGLVRQLGVSVQEETIINRSARKYSLTSPDAIVVEPEPSDLPMLESINTMLLFPKSAPVSVLPTEASAKWKAMPVLNVSGKNFFKLHNTITNAPTPTLLGVFLTAADVEQKQKVVVIGDADFLSNQFIGFGQNTDFAVNLCTYLSAPDDIVVLIEQRVPPAVVIAMDTLSRLALLFIVIVPMMVLVLGLWLRRWLRRRM